MSRLAHSRVGNHESLRPIGVRFLPAADHGSDLGTRAAGGGRCKQIQCAARELGRAVLLRFALLATRRRKASP